jgi:hypothetical protein
MTGMARDEIPELRALRDEYDRVRDALMEGIGKYLDRGETNARIARSVDWTREYIARIRKDRDAEVNAAEQPPSSE